MLLVGADMRESPWSIVLGPMLPVRYTKRVGSLTKDNGPMAKDTFTLAMAQMRVAPEAATNMAAAEFAIRAAAKAGAQVVCLPELFLGPYFCQKEDANLFDLAEPIPGPHSERLAKAAKANGVVVVGSIFEKRMPGLFHNTATVHDADGSLLGIYRKTHIPDDPLYFEKYYFTPGDLGFQCFATKYAKVGPLVCWDQWYPEAA